MHPNKPWWLQWLKRSTVARTESRRQAGGPTRLHISGADPLGRETGRGAEEQFAQAHQEMRRQGRLFGRLAVAWTVCGIVFLTFVCWCAYHILRVKGLVP